MTTYRRMRLAVHRFPHIVRNGPRGVEYIHASAYACTYAYLFPNTYWAVPNMGRVHIVHCYGHTSLVDNRSIRVPGVGAGASGVGVASAGVGVGVGVASAGVGMPCSVSGWHYWRPTEDGTPGYSKTRITSYGDNNRRTSITIRAGVVNVMKEGGALENISAPSLHFLSHLVEAYYGDTRV